MKKPYALVMVVAIAYIGISTISFGGIKSQKPYLQQDQHNSRNAIKQLESKINHEVTVAWNENNSTPAFIGGKLTQAGYSQSEDKSIDGVAFLSENKEIFGLNDPSEELQVISNMTDELMMTHVKYQQVYKGLQIFPCQLIIHINRDGSIESVNGRYIPTPEVDIRPSLSQTDVIAIAGKKLEGYIATEKSAELMIYSDGTTFRLAYVVRMPSFETPNMVVYIDAKDGSIIKKDDGIRYDGPAVGTGIGLKGTPKPIHTYLSGTTYYMIDASLPMFVAPVDSFKGVVATYDALNDTAGNGYKSVGGVFTDPNNDNNFNDNERLKAAVDAHAYSREVYEIFKTRFNRNSFDNAGTTLTNIVHFKENYNNAFWNGFFMTYGDGDGVRFSNLAGGFDVIAHEMTHGVTDKTANLVYELQSGALNEAVSDIFAVIADSTNWLLGEDVFTPAIAGDALRNIQDPHNGKTINDPDWQPAHMNEFVVLANDEDHDNGGVHINSGIINKSFYNLATAIGRTKGGLIWYRALTVYLTNNSQFVDARNACLNAAKDLFGNGSGDYNAVADAFTAVGIGENSGTSFDITYDDGTPSTDVYEDFANWELAVRFTPPIANVTITSAQIYISGTNAGDASCTIKMYHANGNNNLPGSLIINPYPYSPTVAGWHLFNITGTSVSGDFYVSVAYDGTNKPLIGADPPPGNQKAYEYDGSNWVKLTSPNDYTLFMRAKVSSATSFTEIDSKIPSKFELFQNYPNPFNPSTAIRYSLPNTQQMQLTVYDVYGKKIADLVDNVQNAGSYEVIWNGLNNNGESVASGVYFYKLNISSQTDRAFNLSKKMILLK